jgi:hypothetical protein
MLLNGVCKGPTWVKRFRGSICFPKVSPAGRQFKLQSRKVDKVDPEPVFFKLEAAACALLTRG